MESRDPVLEPIRTITSAEAAHTLLASFLGWALDAFDFFILIFVMPAVAREFHRPISHIAFTITATLALRPVGALIFGWVADRYGRRIPLMVDVIFYSVVEVLSGLAPSYGWFLFFRALYGIGMGGEWGVGASLAMEAVAPRWRAHHRRHSRQLEIVLLPLRADDDDELRLARHPGHVSDLPRKNPRLRYPHRRDHRGHL